MIIAVIGSGAGLLALPEVLADAEAVGREIGRRGHTLVCGGRVVVRGGRPDRAELRRGELARSGDTD